MQQVQGRIINGEPCRFYENKYGAIDLMTAHPVHTTKAGIVCQNPALDRL